MDRQTASQTSGQKMVGGTPISKGTLCMTFKGARYIFFKKHFEILVCKESSYFHIFLTTLCEFYSWNVCRLEDICENMTNYSCIS